MILNALLVAYLWCKTVIDWARRLALSTLVPGNKPSPGQQLRKVVNFVEFLCQPSSAHSLFRFYPLSLQPRFSLCFLVACTRLYKSLCRSVGPLVGRSVGWSVAVCEVLTTYGDRPCFVCNKIYNYISVVDNNLTWRASCVCVSVCVSRGNFFLWITFERFELERWNFWLKAI